MHNGDEIVVMLTGLTDGAAFEGSDVIRVIDKGDSGSKDITANNDSGSGIPGNMENTPDKDNKANKKK